MTSAQEELLVTALTRLVLVGADGIRLHEEVFLAARAVPPQGRSRRIEVEERRFEELRRSSRRLSIRMPVSVAAGRRGA